MKCLRCNGTGYQVVKLGKPTTDTHVPYSEVEWLEPVSRICLVCHGEGTKWRRPPIVGSFVIVDDVAAFEAETAELLTEWRDDDR